MRLMVTLDHSTNDVKRLIRQRRDCKDTQQRRELFKRIYKFACKHARQYCTSQTRLMVESLEVSLYS